jgi:two-component system sensor histidine kinase TctE
MLPLVLTWGLGMAGALSVANYFTQEAYDRSLLDDAFGVAAHVVVQGGALALILSPGEISTVLFDQSESVFFAVQRADGSLVAGHNGLYPPRPPAGASYEFADIVYQGRAMRAVTVRRMQPLEFEVVMAQTTASRTRLLQRLLLVSILPQMVLLAVLAWWLRRAIQSDLEPLNTLQRAVDSRDASDLTALPAELSALARSRDIERLGVAINSLLERIEAGIRAQREFAGSVAHELRTPLAGIRALAEYGLAQSRPESWREQLRDIVQSEARASHLIDQLLALALADEAGSALRLEPVPLAEVVRRVVLQFLQRADAGAVDLGARGLELPVMVMAHPALLEGLLSNLIDNALRYGRVANGPAPAVTVAITLERDEQGLVSVRLSVLDNGPGLPQPAPLVLTRRWTQGAAGARLGQGAGLGLAIVSRYAELMQARLELSPGADGKGLQASVIFKAAGDAQA